MNSENTNITSKLISDGECVLGIELGSTRIKAVLVGPDNAPLASGGFGWENSLIDGYWTYSIDEVWEGIQSCYAELKKDVKEQYGVTLGKIKSMGVSAMMHGYMPFNESGELLAAFRTWRNNTTGEASKQLTELFNFSIPQRWSIAHLYQAILNGESHVSNIAFQTTLAGYVHWKLTGEKVMGIGEASGMFPIDLETQDFDSALIQKFDEAVADQSFAWNLKDILPKVLNAGEKAGEVTEEGAKLLDPEGDLQAGFPMCPPEGDAGTGMVATNSVAVRTGNVSAGTSVFAMIVVEQKLSKPHGELDLVTTPDGKLVAMAHSNNCSSDSDAWMGIFKEVTEVLGFDAKMSTVFDTILEHSLSSADADAGGLLSFGYVSGEHITGFEEGRPVFVRSSDSKFTLANLVRSNLYSALCALRTGLNVLVKEEGVQVDEIRGHGGFFKAAEVGKRMMSAATEFPVSTLETAGEGGAWGIALLAAYAVRESQEQTLPQFLDVVFEASMSEATAPNPADLEGFEAYFERYHKGLAIERAAVESIS